MPRAFAYLRVSSAGQTTENQIREIEAAGFKVEPRRVVSETVSGSCAIEQRPGFMKLMDRLERNDVLIVTKMDRLGRNAIDVATIVEKLSGIGVRVYCLALGGMDLTSPAGKMTMGVINSVAQFERDLLIERTQSGLKRAKAEGAVFGRPVTLDEGQREAVRRDLARGVSVSELARRYHTSRQTVMRARDGAAPAAYQPADHPRTLLGHEDGGTAQRQTRYRRTMSLSATHRTRSRQGTPCIDVCE
jgi:putative DNA-invertase from lambdoid prophage Rac